MTSPTPNETPSQTLDAALSALGFVKASRLGATVWKGSYRDGATRACSVTVSRQSRTRYAGEVRYRQHLGFRLRLEVETSIPTRLYFVKEGFASNRLIRWIYRWRKQQVLEQVPPVLSGFHVVAADAPWAGRLIGEQDAMATVGHLLRDGASETLAGSVYFEPDAVHYGSPNLPGEALTSERALDGLRRLVALAKAAERLRPPEIISAVSPFGRFAKARPMAAGLVILGTCLVVLPTAGMIAMMLLFLLVR